MPDSSSVRLGYTLKLSEKRESSGVDAGNKQLAISETSVQQEASGGQRPCESCFGPIGRSSKPLTVELPSAAQIDPACSRR